MEEFLISGLAVHKKWRGFRDGEQGVWTDFVSPDSFFFDGAMRDVRGWDMNIVGQIHEVDEGGMVRRFCGHAAGLCRDEGAVRARQGYEAEGDGGVAQGAPPRRLVHDPVGGSVAVVEEDEWQGSRRGRAAGRDGSRQTCGDIILSTPREDSPAGGIPPIATGATLM